MKIGIVYGSLTGNTKLIAEKIGEEFKRRGHVITYFDLMTQKEKRMDGEELRKHDII